MAVPHAWTAVAGCFGVAVILLARAASAQWVQVGSDLDGEAAWDASGVSVSLSADGSRVAVGAPDNAGGGSQSGHVRVFEYLSPDWVQLGGDIDGEAAEDSFGFSVSLSADGSRLAVGAPGNDDAGDEAGHVRVFQWDWVGSRWAPIGGDIDGEAAGDWAGYSVALSANGERVAIGAPRNSGAASQAGQVRVYGWVEPDWVQLGSDLDGEALGDEFGRSASISADGSRVAAGAIYNDGGGGFAGHVRVFEWLPWTSTWLTVGADLDGEAAGDWSGRSVALSGDGSRVAIGAPHNSDGGHFAGHVRVYEWVESNWVRLGPDIDGEAAEDQSGWSISMSTDGTRVAVGAPFNNDGGNSAGHVRVYEWFRWTSTWLQVDSDLDGEAARDSSGSSVSVSADGSLVAVGAPNNGGNGSAAGQVRVFLEAVFVDGFESGDTSHWSAVDPGA